MPTTSTRPASLVDVARETTDEVVFSFALRNFLDEFYAHPSPDKLAGDPPLLTDILHDKGRADAYLAATAAFLAQKYGLGVPEWARRENRTLHTPFFALDSHAARMWLLVDSPTAFRERNIFVSADALARA